MYTVYATLADLAEYLGTAVDSLSDDSTRLLTRASELVKQQTLGNIIPTNALHTEALKLAVCAQVEFWNDSGEGVSVSGRPQSFSLGSLSMQMGSGSSGSQFGGLCSRAVGYLNEECLLYRGIGRGRVLE